MGFRSFIFGRVKSHAVTWNGSVNNDWFNAFNWTPNVVPTIANDAIIPSAPNYAIINNASTAVAKSVTISTGRLDINTNLTVDGAVSNTSGTFNMLLNSSLLQNTNVANSGLMTLTANTTMTANNYTFWCAPVFGNQLLIEFTPDSNPKYCLSYDGTFTFLNTAGTSWTMLGTGVGLEIQCPLGISTPTLINYFYLGTPNNGTLTIGPTAVAAPKLRMIGNIYPSAISTRAFILANIGTIDGSIYTWDSTPTAATTNYGIINLFGSTRIAYGYNSTTYISEYLKPGFGFVVNILNTNNIVINNSMRVHKSLAVPTVGTQLGRCWVTIKASTNLFAQVLLGYDSSSTTGTDRGYDAPRGTFTFSFEMYIISGPTLFYINARPIFSTADIFTLGYSTNFNGSHIISLEQFDGLFTGQNVYLVDTVLSTTTNLKLGTYTLKSATGSGFNTRFYIKFVP